MKKLNFNITDNTTYNGVDSAEFYSKALLEGVSTSTFRPLIHVKSKIKMPRYDATNMIKDAGCSWEPSGAGTLDQKEMEVCSKEIQFELCTNTYEQNFLGELLKAGSNTGEVTPLVFQNYVISEIVKSVKNDLEIVTWQGNSGTSSVPYNVCDGLLLKFAADSSVLKATPAATITKANVIAEITKLYNKIPDTIIGKEDLVLYVSIYIAKLYTQAIAEASSEAYYVGAKELNFLGIKMIVAPGLPSGSMVAAQSNNIAYLTDLSGDEETLEVIPQAKITGTRTVRFSGAFKFGVDYFISEEIVTYIGAIA